MNTKIASASAITVAVGIPASPSLRHTSAVSPPGRSPRSIASRNAPKGIEVIEQPAFWDIRSRGRLSISYGEVSEQLGYEIDAYSIQHEMSTHDGRMFATDDALMLFSDPTEAMQYLMA